ncbi:Bacterial SH3 domain protein [Phycisphaerae bacterium RAS1]|nr:Bacterial SH3 domain protein [Phycisphaerae bacterium RAS1]
MTRVVTACALLALVAPFAAPAASVSPERLRELLGSAQTAFDEATAAARSDPAGAAGLYRQSAAAFDSVAAAGVISAGLEFNRGNTHFRLGNVGRAIVHYRRGLRLQPRDADLRANLAYARLRVEPQLPSGESERLVERLLFFHYKTSLRERFWLAALLAGGGWLLLTVRIWRPVKPLAACGLTLVLLGATFSVSALWQLQAEAAAPAAVVVGEPQTLRQGRGEAYEAVLREALGPGVELRILESRGEWVEVRLSNGQSGWLPRSAVEPI